MSHLLVLGASGVSGWAVMHQALTYPTPTTFEKITGTTNRPMTKEKALLPENEERVRLVSGIDFTRPVDEVKSMLSEKITDINTVTHVIYAGRFSSRNGSHYGRSASLWLTETGQHTECPQKKGRCHSAQQTTPFWRLRSQRSHHWPQNSGL